MQNIQQGHRIVYFCIEINAEKSAVTCFWFTHCFNETPHHFVIELQNTIVPRSIRPIDPRGG